jgi:hypothetical protein
MFHRSHFHTEIKQRSSFGYGRTTVLLKAQNKVANTLLISLASHLKIIILGVKALKIKAGLIAKKMYAIDLSKA